MLLGLSKCPGVKIRIHVVLHFDVKVFLSCIFVFAAKVEQVSLCVVTWLSLVSVHTTVLNVWGLCWVKLQQLPNSELH